MPETRSVLTPDTLAMLQTISRTGSFAAAARSMGLVPSALTYRVRQIEEALDVLLFDRRSRNARPTPAGISMAGSWATCPSCSPSRRTMRSQARRSRCPTV